MKVNVLNAYNNPYTNSLSERANNNGVTLGVGLNKVTTPATPKANSDLFASKNVLTKQEKSFFKKLFPENSEQIERHVLFNRNGKVHNGLIIKGSIVDGRI